MRKLTTGNIDPSKRIIVIAAAPNIHRQYYDTPFQEGAKKAPVCFSSDSKKPDINVSDPQSKFCVLCPKNIQGSGGGKSRACKFHQKTAVSLDGSLAGPVYQMVISSMSLFKKSTIYEDMGFLQYAKRLLQQGQSISNLVTQVSVVKEGLYSRISFKPVLHLRQEELKYVKQRVRTEEVYECLTFPVVADLKEARHFFGLRKKMGMLTEV